MSLCKTHLYDAERTSILRVKVGLGTDRGVLTLCQLSCLLTQVSCESWLRREVFPSTIKAMLTTKDNFMKQPVYHNGIHDVLSFADIANSLEGLTEFSSLYSEVFSWSYRSL